jgi:membrane fusion protein, copper/silver efflux system
MMKYLPLFYLILLTSCTDKKQVEHKEHLANSDVTKTLQDDEIQLTAQQIQLGNIKTDTLRSRNMNNQTVLTAVLNFDQTKTSAVSSRVMGRIEVLYFKNIGDYINKGDKLYDLYSEELNTAKQEYLSALVRQKVFADNLMVDFNTLIQSARHKLTLWGMSETQIALMEQAGKVPITTTFYSPNAGYITALNVQQGDNVMEGSTIVQLADLSTLWAEAQVFTTQFAQIQSNTAIIVRVPPFENEPIQGKISFVNPEIIPDSRINLLRISIPNKNNKLKPGMSANVYINTGKQTSLRLPIDAIIRDAKGATVWIKTGENTFKSKMIEVGAEANNFIEIKNGLLSGDLVVVTGAYLLQSEYLFKKGTNPMAGHKM